MKRFLTTLLALASTTCSAGAFTVLPSPSSRAASSALFYEQSSTYFHEYAQGKRVDHLPGLIANLRRENFEQGLSIMEPMFKSECLTRADYEFYMCHLKERCAMIGLHLPSNYAPVCQDASQNWE